MAERKALRRWDGLVQFASACLDGRRNERSTDGKASEGQAFMVTVASNATVDPPRHGLVTAGLRAVRNAAGKCWANQVLAHIKRATSRRRHTVERGNRARRHATAA